MLGVGVGGAITVAVGKEKWRDLSQNGRTCGRVCGMDGRDELARDEYMSLCVLRLLATVKDKK